MLLRKEAYKFKILCKLNSNFKRIFLEIVEIYYYLKMKTYNVLFAIYSQSYKKKRNAMLQRFFPLGAAIALSFCEGA